MLRISTRLLGDEEKVILPGDVGGNSDSMCQLSFEFETFPADHDYSTLRYGKKFGEELSKWWSKLAWPVEKEENGNQGISFVEFVVDFMISAGMRTPFRVGVESTRVTRGRKAIGGYYVSSEKPEVGLLQPALQHDVRILLQVFEELLQVEHCRAPPGRIHHYVPALRHFGVQLGVAGLLRRPRLLCEIEVIRTLKDYFHLFNNGRKAKQDICLLPHLASRDAPRDERDLLPHVERLNANLFDAGVDAGQQSEAA
ncbi:unnamed protein product [Polarella glacialis]|uniref:Uncharacterized protein n=1 Tax=Polarella glacialis TaxID=89957 RepID=A0A813HB80_POLGL|nr:unnamed protein product [Polarella glacialis]